MGVVSLFQWVEGTIHILSSLPPVKLPYSAMQTDRNCYCGDVLLNIVNIAFRDEDRIVCQIYQSKYAQICIKML